MKYINRASIKFLLLLACLPGCARYYDWGSQHFKQADKRDINNDIVKSYSSTMVLYDGFQTVGLFDVLWYADPIRELYEQQVIDRYGKLPTTSKVQLAEGGATHQEVPVDPSHAKELVFYVMLSLIDDIIRPLMSATNAEALWTPVLCVGEALHTATEVKKVTLEPELKRFFGPLDDRYRATYKVVFNRYDANNTDLSQQALTLYVQSARYKVAFTWTPTEDGGVRPSAPSAMDGTATLEPESELSLID